MKCKSKLCKYLIMKCKSKLCINQSCVNLMSRDCPYVIFEIEKFLLSMVKM